MTRLSTFVNDRYKSMHSLSFAHKWITPEDMGTFDSARWWSYNVRRRKGEGVKTRHSPKVYLQECYTNRGIR